MAKITQIKLPNLRRSRLARKISQGVLATKARVTTYAVAVAELKRAIRLEDAQKIATALGIKLQSLRG